MFKKGAKFNKNRKRRRKTKPNVDDLYIIFLIENFYFYFYKNIIVEGFFQEILGKK
jgi:hypothetical protein